MFSLLPYLQAKNTGISPEIKGFWKMFLLLKKARYVIRNEGFLVFLKRALLFIRHSIFFSRKYYLHKGKLAEMPREAQIPEVENFTVKVVSNNREYEVLSDTGFLFKPWKPEYRGRLDQGALAFCAFSGTQLVHVSWCARSRKAMKALKEPPYKVDFAHNEAANGDYWTHPGYRGKNIAHYVTRMRQQYLRENGVVTTRGAIPLDNQASQRIPRTRRSRVYAIAKYIKILWWQYCRETPYDSSIEQAGGET